MVEYNDLKGVLIKEEINDIIDKRDTELLERKSTEDLGLIPCLIALKAVINFSRDPDRLR